MTLFSLCNYDHEHDRTTTTAWPRVHAPWPRPHDRDRTTTTTWPRLHDRMTTTTRPMTTTAWPQPHDNYPIVSRFYIKPSLLSPSMNSCNNYNNVNSCNSCNHVCNSPHFQYGIAIVSGLRAWRHLDAVDIYSSSKTSYVPRMPRSLNNTTLVRNITLTSYRFKRCGQQSESAAYA